MPSPGGQFFSDEFGDIEDYFVSDYRLIDQYIGDQLWTWGFNFYGQLGVNNTASRSTPVTTILGGTNWKSVDCGRDHTLAIKTDGTLWSWGRNSYGALGVNDTTSRSTPVTTILGGNNWKLVSGGGDHTSAIKTDGTLWTWGRNSYGQLGVNNITSRSTPVTTFLGGTNWKSVDCGRDHTLAIKTDGTLWTWGLNSDGQLGVNDTTSRSTPVTTILGGTNWESISNGWYHTAATKTDGSLWLWGYNSFGQLGVNDVTQRSTPVTTILGGTNWKSVDCGLYHTAAIKTDGTLWNWGFNSDGQLGVNNITSRSTPVTTILGGNNWKSVDCGTRHTSAIKTDGTLWNWGDNASGQLGINQSAGSSSRSTPVTTILGGNNWKSVDCGGDHTSAITAGVEIDFTPPTEVIFDVPGTYTWVAPEDVTSVSVVCVGGGGGPAANTGGASGAGGGGLGWKNNISVTPGTGYTVVVGSGGTRATTGTAGAGGVSYFIDTTTVAGFGGGGGACATNTVGAGGTFVGDGGGNGGNGGSRNSTNAGAGGGGGAGGYSGNGGNGGGFNATASLANGSAGSGGGGGGGGGCGSADSAGSGGGVGLFGEGTSGNGGAGSGADGAGGFGGSGGTDASQASATAPGNVYGTAALSTPGSYGGGGCGADNTTAEQANGGNGAVRIVWSYDGTTPTFG